MVFTGKFTENRSPTRQFLLLAAVFSLSFAFLGCAGQQPGSLNQTINTSALTAEGTSGQTQAQALEKNSLRPNSNLPASVFALLPPLPKDFFEKRGLFKSGKISLKEFGDLGEDYWKQPEAFQNFEEYAVREMLNPPAGRWGAKGYGAFPNEFTARAKPGDSVETIVFFKTSWLVESYQGMELSYSVSSGGQQQPAQGISVEITPKEFLLEPAYPVFSKGWVQKVSVKAVVSTQAQEGEYDITIDPVKPQQNASLEWSKKNQPYLDAGGVGLSRPFFKISLTVKR